MARALFAIQAAAVGRPGARRQTGLSPHAARLALGYLLASEPFTDNIGILRQALPTGMPVAQKHGWLSRARHTAAILYTPSGPWIVVAQTYADGLSRSEAAVLGRRAVALVPTR